MMVNYETNLYGRYLMDIGAIIIVGGAILTLPVMYAIRYIFIEKKQTA